MPCSADPSSASQVKHLSLVFSKGSQALQLWDWHHLPYKALLPLAELFRFHCWHIHPWLNWLSLIHMSKMVRKRGKWLYVQSYRWSAWELSEDHSDPFWKASISSIWQSWWPCFCLSIPNDMYFPHVLKLRVLINPCTHFPPSLMLIWGRH